MRRKPIFAIFVLILATLVAGCVNAGQPEKAGVTTGAGANATPSSADLERLNALDTRVQALESQVSEMHRTIEYNGILPESGNRLIPSPPFSIIVCCGKDRTYLFRTDSVVEVTEGKDPAPLFARYELYPANNTIKIQFNKTNFNTAMLSEDTYEDFRLRLFDNYVASIYETGLVDWISTYRIELNTSSRWARIMER